MLMIQQEVNVTAICLQFAIGNHWVAGMLPSPRKVKAHPVPPPRGHELEKGAVEAAWKAKDTGA